MEKEGKKMETSTKQIKALDIYYEVSKKEFDDSHKYYDVVDNKVNVFFAISIGVPTLLLSWFKIHIGTNIPFIVVCLGFLSLIGVFIFVFLSLRIRKTTFGVPNNIDFQTLCTKYNNETMKESIAEMWLKSAENNYSLAIDKANKLQFLQWFCFSEVILFILAIITSLCF